MACVRKREKEWMSREAWARARLDLPLARNTASDRVEPAFAQMKSYAETFGQCWCAAYLCCHATRDCVAVAAVERTRDGDAEAEPKCQQQDYNQIGLRNVVDYCHVAHWRTPFQFDLSRMSVSASEVCVRSSCNAFICRWANTKKENPFQSPDCPATIHLFISFSRIRMGCERMLMERGVQSAAAVQFTKRFDGLSPLSPRPLPWHRPVTMRTIHSSAIFVKNIYLLIAGYQIEKSNKNAPFCDRHSWNNSVFHCIRIFVGCQAYTRRAAPLAAIAHFPLANLLINEADKWISLLVVVAKNWPPKSRVNWIFSLSVGFIYSSREEDKNVNMQKCYKKSVSKAQNEFRFHIFTHTHAQDTLNSRTQNTRPNTSAAIPRNVKRSVCVTFMRKKFSF